MFKYKKALSPYNKYCDGYGNHGASGNNYIIGLTLGVGNSDLSLSHEGSRTLSEINAFDRAETYSAYIGQVNMSIVSSFCGLNGMIWGYDIAKSDKIYSRHKVDLKDIVLDDGFKVNVYSAVPLIDATIRLFGTVSKKRFPLMPGAHVPFAGKNIKMHGPKNIYSGIAIGVPEDRSRNACLLMEDMGYIPTDVDKNVKKYKQVILQKLAQSVVEVGKNQRVKFKEIFVEMNNIFINEGDIGCALVAAPYFTLARNAAPEDINLNTCSLDEWEKRIIDKI